MPKELSFELGFSLGTFSRIVAIKPETSSDSRALRSRDPDWAGDAGGTKLGVDLRACRLRDGGLIRNRESSHELGDRCV